MSRRLDAPTPALRTVAGPSRRMASRTPSIAGTSHATRTGESFGSQTRRAMLIAMKVSSAAPGGQRDSPIGSSGSTAGDVALLTASGSRRRILAEARALEIGRPSAVEDRQVEQPEPLGVGEDVELDDPPPAR